MIENDVCVHCRDIALIKIAEVSLGFILYHVHGVLLCVASFSPGSTTGTKTMHDASRVTVVSV